MRPARRHRVLLVIALLALSGCATDLSFLAAHGPVAEAQKAHILRIALVTAIVVVPAIVLGPFVAWRYRYRGGARYTPRWDFSWPVEAALWGIPIAVTLSLMALLARSTFALDPHAPLPGGDPFEVQVIGYDWKWLFVYPGAGVASVGESSSGPPRARCT